VITKQLERKTAKLRNENALDRLNLGEAKLGKKLGSDGRARGLGGAADEVNLSKTAVGKRIAGGEKRNERAAANAANSRAVNEVNLRETKLGQKIEVEPGKTKFKARPEKATAATTRPAPAGVAEQRAAAREADDRSRDKLVQEGLDKHDQRLKDKQANQEAANAINLGQTPLGGQLGDAEGAAAKANERARNKAIGARIRELNGLQYPPQ